MSCLAVSNKGKCGFSRLPVPDMLQNGHNILAQDCFFCGDQVEILHCQPPD